METLKLVLVTLGFLILIFGFFFLAFSILGKKDKKSPDNCETTPIQKYGCGCRTGACGIPIN